MATTTEPAVKVETMPQFTEGTLKSYIPEGPIQEKWDKHRFEMKLINPANRRRFTIIMVGSGLAGAGRAALALSAGAALF